MYIRKFKYTAKELECEYCAERMRGGKCAHKKCPYIAEKVEANAITYGDVLSNIDFPDRSICNRLPHLIESHPDSFWLDERHMTRMNLLNNRLGFVARINTPSYYAAMYLLTASDTLLARTQKCFTDTGIDFDFSTLSGISLNDYVLYKAAVCYYTKQGGVTPDELADNELVNDQLFRLVINGLLISKYGLAAMLLKKNLKGAKKK